MAIRSFVRYIPIRVFSVSPVLASSINNQPFISVQVSLEDATDEIMRQISSGPDLSVPRDEICISFIRKLCASGNLLVATKLPEVLRSKQVFLSHGAYDCLLEAANNKGDVDVMSQVFKDLLVCGTCVRLSSFLIAGRAFQKHSNPVVLLNFIREICDMELPRIDIVLNRFIFALAKCGYVEGALLVFNHMKSFKCEPDLVTYNTILAILGRVGRVDEMLHEFAFMKTRVNLIPDVVTYNTILNSLRKKGRLDLCLLYFKEMSERGIQPDEFTFKALIESLGRSGNIEEALRIFDKMRSKGIYPSVHIYRALVFNLKRMGKLDLALKISTEMDEVHRNR